MLNGTLRLPLPRLSSTEWVTHHLIFEILSRLLGILRQIRDRDGCQLNEAGVLELAYYLPMQWLMTYIRP